MDGSARSEALSLISDVSSDAWEHWESGFVTQRTARITQELILLEELLFDERSGQNEVCEEWTCVFPHFRIRGRQIIPAREQGFQLITSPRAASPYFFTECKNLNDFAINGTLLQNEDFFHSDMHSSELDAPSGFGVGSFFDWSDSGFDDFLENCSRTSDYCSFRYYGDAEHGEMIKVERIINSAEHSFLSKSVARSKTQAGLCEFLICYEYDDAPCLIFVPLLCENRIQITEIDILMAVKDFPCRFYIVPERDVPDLVTNPRYLLTYAKVFSDTSEHPPTSPYGEQIFASDGLLSECDINQKIDYTRRHSLPKSPLSTIKQDIADCVFDDIWSEIVIVLQPLIEIIALEMKTEPVAESLKEDAADLVNIESAMTIRPIPLQIRKFSAKHRSIDSESSQPTLSHRPASRPGSAKLLTRTLELKSLYGNTLSSRAPSAATFKIQNLKRNNGGMRLIPLGQQTSSILNDTLYGTSIIGVSRGTLPTLFSRPGTGFSKRLPPLRTSFSDPLNPITSQQSSRHVLFDALTAGISHEYPFSTSIPARPFSAKRPGLAYNMRAKSARPVLREDQWTSVTGTRLGSKTPTRITRKVN